MKKTSIFGKLAMGLFAGLCFLTGSGTATAQDTYVKITSAEELEIGQKYLIVCEGDSVAWSSDDLGTTVSISDNTIVTTIATNANEKSLPHSFTLGGTTDAYTFLDDFGNYIHHEEKTTINRGSETNWAISFEGNGDALIQASSRYILYRNATTDFRAYTNLSQSGTNPIQLYKKQEAAPDAPTVSLQPSILDLSTTPNEATTGTITVTGANEPCSPFILYATA